MPASLSLSFSASMATFDSSLNTITNGSERGEVVDFLEASDPVGFPVSHLSLDRDLAKG